VVPLQNKINYKAIEIEDFIDLYFYHPLGYLFAVFFNKIGFTPNSVSLISMVVGILGGVMIFYDKLLLACFLIVLASVLDSADGQLARISGKTSLYGRIIDGIVGYVIFSSIYISIFLRYYKHYGYFKYLFFMFACGFSNSIHAGIYDFYRTAYVSVIKKKFDDIFFEKKETFYSRIYEIYSLIQKKICSIHIQVLKKIYDSNFDEKKITIYREKMLSNIGFINILGDNWRINGIIILSLIKRIDLFYFYIIFIMNVIMILVVLKQRKIDRKLMEVL
jgi:phosphatidylserine synthase